MTDGGVRQLGHGTALTYTRHAMTATRATAVERSVEEPVSVNVSVRSKAIDKTYASKFNHDSAQGQLLDCYI
jgi:hypothetical protein